MEGIAILVGCLICGILAACIARSKGRSAMAWFIAGLFSGIIAVIIVALQKPLQASNSQASKRFEQSPTLQEKHTALKNGISTAPKEELLGDVIPPPRRERRIKVFLGGSAKIYPRYTVNLKSGSPTWKSSPVAWIDGSYVEICRVPLADVSEVKIYEKPYKEAKLIFKGW